MFGLQTKFGGGSSQGFGLIYDDEDSQKKFEPRYRLVRVSATSPSNHQHPHRGFVLAVLVPGRFALTFWFPSPLICLVLPV